MTRATSLALALCMMGTLALAATPAADAAVQCAFAPSPVGGVVGRTHEYVTNVGEAVCNETAAYAFYLCVFAFGPAPICYVA